MKVLHPPVCPSENNNTFQTFAEVKKCWVLNPGNMLDQPDIMVSAMSADDSTEIVQTQSSMLARMQ